MASRFTQRFAETPWRRAHTIVQSEASALLTSSVIGRGRARDDRREIGVFLDELRVKSVKRPSRSSITRTCSSQAAEALMYRRT